MTVFFNRQQPNPFGSIAGILVMVLFGVGMFFLAKGVYWLLAKVAFFLLAAALVIHHRTILDFGKWLWSLILQKPLQGVLLTALGVLLYPILFTYLFFRALVNRKVSKLQEAIRKEREGEWVDFEEMESTFHQRRSPKTDRSELEIADRYGELFE